METFDTTSKFTRYLFSGLAYRLLGKHAHRSASKNIGVNLPKVILDLTGTSEDHNNLLTVRPARQLSGGQADRKVSKFPSVLDSVLSRQKMRDAYDAQSDGMTSGGARMQKEINVIPACPAVRFRCLESRLRTESWKAGDAEQRHFNRESKGKKGLEVKLPPSVRTFRGMFIILFLFILTSVSAVSQGIFSDWKYYREITLNNTSNTETLTDYSALIIVNTKTLIAQGKMNSDGSDIRFTTDFSTELDYWIEPGIQNEFGINDDSTHIWIKVPNIVSSSNTTIYMLYGNSSAISKSDIGTTFLFGEDFDDNNFNTSKWDTLYEGQGQVDEQNKRLEHNSPATYPESQSIVYSKQNFTGPVVLEMRFKKGGYVYRSLGLSGLTGMSDNNCTWFDWQDWGQIDVGVRLNGTPTSYDFRTDTWSAQYNPEYYLKVIRDKDSTFSFFETIPAFEEDGYKHYEYKMSDVKMPLDTPLIVFTRDHVWQGASSLLIRYEDDIRIRKYSYPEPLTSVGSEYMVNGLVAYYPFDGNTADSSGNGNDGVNNGATLTMDRFGNANSAYSFNGSSSYIDLGDQDILNPHQNSYTLSTWAKKSVLSQHARMVSKGTNGGSQPGYSLMFYPGSGPTKAAMIFSAGDGEHIIYSNNSIDDLSWHHYSGVVNRQGYMTLYVDDVKQNDSINISDHASTSIGAGTYDAAIGASYSYNGSPGLCEYFNGSLDEVRIYERVLGAAEIDSLYHEGGWPIPPNITSFTPTRNALNVLANTNITVTFDQSIDESTNFQSTIKINGSQSGRHVFAHSYNSSTKTITLYPDVQFKVGELVTVTATRGIKGTSGDSLAAAKTWSFTIVVDGGTGQFAQTSTPSVGNYPYSITSGDFNGDGLLDLAVTNGGANNISVLLNSGNGIFIQSSTVIVGNNPTSITAGDLNGDGFLDLAVTNQQGSNTISILLNNGDGSFTQSSIVSVGVWPTSITAGDFNGDGAIDLAVTNAISNTVSILINNVNGTFTQSATSYNGNGLFTVKAGDFNGDGILDLVVGDTNDKFLSLLINNGNGVFTQDSPLNVGFRPMYFALGDYNCDGYLDLAIANCDSTIVSILLNNGNGTFTQSSTTYAGTNAGTIATGDFNGDGSLDLAVTNVFSKAVSILLNNGNGIFTRNSTANVGNNSYEITAGDFNEDGILDLAIANSNDNTVSILLNTQAIVTFRVDMRNAMAWGRFNPTSDSVVVRGSSVPLQWSGEQFPMSDPDGDSIYTATILFNTTGDLQYKYVVRRNQSDCWEDRIHVNNINSGNRSYIIVSGAQSTPIVSWDDLPPYETLFGEYYKDASTVLLLHMNDTTSRRVLDYSSYGNNGTATGTTIVGGKFGNARNFAGTGNYITVPSQVSLGFGTDPFTVEGWVKIANSNSNCAVIAKVQTNGYELRINSSGQVEAYIQDVNNNVANISTARSVVDNQWHHWAMTRDASTLKLFIDGILENQISATNLTGNIANSDPLYIGSAPNSDPFTGSIDEVRISNVARTPEEFNLQLPPKNLMVNISGNSIDLTWQNGGGLTPFKNYKVYRGTDSLNVELRANTIGLSYPEGNLQAGATYYYRVSTVDSTDFESTMSYAVSATPNNLLIVIDANKDEYWNTVTGKIDIGAPQLIWGSVDSPDDASSTLYLAYDQNYLYGYFETKDDVIGSKNNDYWWQNDALDIKFDLNPATTIPATNSGEVPNLRDIFGTQFTAENGFSWSQNGTSNTLVARRSTGTGYAIEFAIPFNEIRNDQTSPAETLVPNTGTEIGAAFEMIDQDQLTTREAQLVYGNSTVNTDFWRDVSQIGHIKFLANNQIEISTVNIAVPAAPNLISAIAGNDQVSLSWNKNIETDFQRYRIYYGTSSPATILKDSTTQRLDTIKVISGLSNGTTYYFRITAVDSTELESGYSNEVSATPQNPYATFYQPTDNLGITDTIGFMGFAWGDYNNDGYIDLYQPGAGQKSIIYKNNIGTNFTQVSISTDTVGTNGAVWADFNGDGKLDILLGHGFSLKLYRGSGTDIFTDITSSSNLNSFSAPNNISIASAADFNKDGDLEIVFAGGVGTNGSGPINLLQNTSGVFSNVAGMVLSSNPSFESWNPAWVDVNNDGNIDLWMPTIRTAGTPCALFINNGSTLNLSDPSTTGLTAASAVISAWGDYDNDGYMDLFLIPFSTDNDGVAKLYHNNGNGTFTNVAHNMGVDSAFADSRGVCWGDYDNDGRLDLLISRRGNQQQLLHNTGSSFVEVGGPAGIAFFGKETRSCMFVDYDNNGFLDIFFTSNWGSKYLFKNNADNGNHWICIKPVAAGNNTSAIGARITTYAGGQKQIRDIQAGGTGGMTNGNIWANFGIGTAISVDSVIIQWPDGNVEVKKNFAANSYYTIQESIVNTPPLIPQNLTATAGNGQVTLTWNANVEFDFAKYNVYYGTSSPASTLIDSTNSNIDTSKIITSLNNGTTYYFRITAVDNAGLESGYSNEVSATPHENITGVLQDFENAAASSFFQTYPANPNLGTGTGYVVLSDVTTPTPVQGSASMQYEWKVDANQTWGGFQGISHFVPQADYQYIDLSSNKYLSIWYNNTVPSSQPGYVNMQFILYEAGGNSQYWSNQADYEAWYFESAPTFYDATPGWKQLIMPLNDRGAVANTNNSGFSLPGWQGIKNNGVLDLDKIVGYSIQVGCSIQGTVVTGICLWDNLQYGTILPLPNAPTGISAIADNNQITLIWNKNTEPDFLRYRIYGSTSSPASTLIDSTTGGINDTSKVISNLNNGTIYYLRITAVNTAGLESGFSDEVRAIPVGPPTVSLFAAKVDFPTGSNPIRIAVGDIDGDGKPDVVAANSYSNTFSVIRNTCAGGNVSFAAKKDFATVKGSFAVAVVGDVDGDGKLDVVISNNGGDTISVYRNTSTIGTVSFAPRVDFVVGSYPYFISLDDVDGDGKLDLAVETNYDLVGNENFKVSIFRNTSTSGNVSFAQRVDFSTGIGHNDMTSGDLDGDGKPDIVMATWNGNSFSILRNTSTSGTVNFETKVDYTTGTKPSDVLIGDIDGDGKPDIIVPNCGDNTVSIFRNTCSSGTLSFAEKVDFTTGNGPGEVAIGDIDQDGKPDIVVVNGQANSISFFSNTSISGTVSFASRVDFTSGVNPEPISIVDLDEDGKSDVVVGNCNSNTISVFRNTIQATAPPLPGEYTADANTVLLMHMDEATGSSVSDASSNGNNGTATGTTIADGRFGKARSFSGGANYIEVPHSATIDFTSSDFTYELWLNVTNATNKTFFQKFTSDGYMFNMDASGRVYAQINARTGMVQLISNTSVADGHWHHVSAVRTLTGGKLYVDGVLVSAQAANLSDASNPNSLQIGSVLSDQGFIGMIDEVRISNKERMPQEFNLQLPPTNLSATVNGSIATLNWQSGGGLIGAAYYRVYIGSDSTNVSFVDSAFATTINSPSLSPGTYYCRISTVDSTGFESAKSYAANVIVNVIPTITSFTPTSGPVGTTVIITGTNFNTTAANNVVHFGAVKAHVLSAPNNQLLLVEAPVGATYAPITVTDMTTGLTAYSDAPFDVTFTSNHIINVNSFVEKAGYTTGSGPEHIAVADFDEDGKPDIVVTDGGTDTISVFKNTSASNNISFAPKIDFASGNAPNGLTTGDLDGDGKSDIVVANPNSGTVSVFRNTSTSGNISFASRIDYTVGNMPIGATIGDLDGDGKPDMAITDWNGTISVFRNTSTIGSISFASKVDYTISNSACGVAIVDLDGDNKPELIVGNTSGVSVFRNTSTYGNISFANKVDITLNNGGVNIVVGDVDGDGKPDIAATQGTIMSVSRNLSTVGNISFATEADFTTGSNIGNSYNIAMSDLDGDGKPDIVVSNHESQSISVFKNISTSGSIALNTKVDFPLSYMPWGFAIVDLDGDSKPDLAATNNSSNKVLMFQNNVSTDVPPNAPQNLAAIPGDSKVTLTWNKNSEVDFLRYYIYWGTSPNPSVIVDTMKGGITDTTKIITGLTNGTTYYFRISAIDNGGMESAFSNEVSAKPTSGPVLSVNPSSLVFGTVTVGATSSEKTYSLSGNNLSPASDNISVIAPTGFEVSLTSGSGFASAINVLYSNGTLNVALYVRFKPTSAISYSGNISNSGGGAATQNVAVSGIGNVAPAAPQNLTVTAGNGQVTLKWSANTESDFAKYRIYYGTTSPASTLIDSTTSNIDTSKIIRSLTNNQTYYFRIKAVDNAGLESDYSNEVNAQPNGPPAAPTNLAANPGNGQVTLTWNANTESDIAKYRIYYGTSSPANTLKDSTSKTDTVISGLNNGTTYYFRITAVDNAGLESAFSSERSATPTSGPVLSVNPASLNFGTVTTSTISGEKTYSLFGANLSPSSEKITVSAPTGFEVSLTSGSGFASSMSVPYSGGLINTTIYVRFSPTAAQGYSGNITNTGGGATTQNVAVSGLGNAAPAAIQIVSAVAGNAKVTLTWNKNTESDFLRYRIYGSTSSPATTLIDSTAQRLDTIKTITQLLNGTTYYFRVMAVDNAGLESGPSNEVSATPMGPLLGEYVADANTVLLLHMNETSGSTVYDASTFSNNGIATGTTIEDGKAGKARKFTSLDGIGINNSSSLNFGTSDLTVECWIKTTSVSTNGIIVKSDGSTGFGLDYHGTDGGKVKIQLNADAAWSHDAVNDGRWHHIAGVRGNNRLQVYIDGLLQNEIDASNIGSISNSADLRIGHIDGSLDEVRISNVARSPREFNLQLPPVNLTATATTNRVDLSWENGGGAIGLLRYKIYRGTDSTNLSLIDSTIQLLYTNSGLISGSSYYYRVSAVDSTGFEGVKSYAVKVTTKPLLGEYAADANTVLLMHMNETSGDTVGDASSYGNNGRPGGGPQIVIVDGRFGKARRFTTSSDFFMVDNPSSLNFSTGNFTLECWIKPDLNLTNDGSLLAKGRWSFNIDIDGKIGVMYIPTGYQYVFGIHPVSLGMWHHVSAVFTQNSIRLYVDGVLDIASEGLNVGNLDNTYSLSIGTNFHGIIDEVRISNITRQPFEFKLQLPPINISAVSAGSAINLSWQNGDGGIGLLRYKIYRGTDSTSLSLIDSIETTSYSNTTGLIPGTTYLYRISAVDSTGFEGAMSYAASATIPIPPPAITSFTPTSGPVGTTVTITGTNFNTTATNNVVYFGAVKAQVLSAVSTQLSVTVPVGATYQPISVTDLTTGLTAYSAKPFIVTYTGGGYISFSSFAPKVDFATGDCPIGVAIGDLDGDGKPEMITKNISSNTISVLRNTSVSGNIASNSFAAKIDFATVGHYSWDFVIGDFDGDGKSDVVSNGAFRNTSVVGSISFVATGDFVGGSFCDLDGDGKPDLVLNNWDGNITSVFRNTSVSGSISFAAKVDFATGNQPAGVAIGDLDGDSKPDLVVTNFNSNTISVFRNTSVSGNISFAAKVDFATGSQPAGVAIGDLDGDGKPDLLLTNRNSNTFSVYRNTSISGSITSSSFADKVDFTTGQYPDRVALSDLDGDGKPDLALTNVGSNTVSVYRNTSVSDNILFTTKVDFTAGINLIGIAIGDLDGDGKPDLAVTDTLSNKVSVLRNIIGIVPIAPSNLTLNVVSSLQITLTWKDNSNNEDGFKIERKTGSGGSYAEIKTVSANTQTFPDNGLEDGTQYYYKVRAYNGAGNSDYCLEANAITKLPAPSNCVATAVAVDSVGVTWNDNSKNESGFRIERKISTGSYSTINTTNASATSYVDNSVSDNTLYYYRVFAINAVTVSDASNEDTTLTPQLDTTPPNAPTNAQISPSGWTNQSTFTITWTNPSDPSGIARVWYSVDAVPSIQSPGTSVDITSPTVQVNVTASGSHQIYLYLADGLGNKNPANIATVTAQFDNVAPDAPGSPAITPSIWSNQSNFTITWTNPSDISGIARVLYTIDSAPTTGSPGTYVDVINPSLQVSVTEEGTHIIYFYLGDVANNSNPGNAVSLTVLYDATSPSPPSSVQKTPSGWTSKQNFNLTWSNPHDSSGIVKAWYRFDLEPSISNPGTGVDISGSNPQIQISLPEGFTSGSHEFYLYLEDAAQNKNPNYFYQTEILFDNHAPTITDNSSLPSEVTVDNSTASPSVYISTSASDGVGESGVRSLQLQYIRVGDAQTYLVNYSPPFNIVNNKQIPAEAFMSSNNQANGVSYLLEAFDSTGNVSRTLWTSIVVRNGGGTPITTTTPLPAASDYPSNQIAHAYRIFSVPYDLDDKRPSSFIPSSLGDHKKDNVQYANWRFQRVVGGAKQDYEDFATDPNAVAPGKGFFLIVKDPQQKVTIGSNKVVRADLMNDNGIQLENGWNLVGTPLNMNIDFDSLVFVGGTYSGRAYYTGVGPVSGWDTTGSNVDILKPWEGLAIHVNGATTLKFRSFGPQLRVGQKDGIYGKVIRAEQPSLSINPMNWTVPVNAYRSDIDMRCEGNGFGMIQDANKGYDKHDSYMPPFVGDKNVAVYFRNPEGAMMRDIRSLNDTGDVWEMRVITGDASAKVKLQFGDMLNLPNQSFEAYLIDIDQKMAHDLKVTSTIEINSGNGVRNFQVVVGIKSFVEANNAGIELHPTTMRLYANYPNPFNPETIIRYTVPNSAEQYHVILKIFNILGQEVVTLVNEEQKSGYYEVKYLAQNQSSGIYFYQITVTSGNQIFRDVKKAVLMK